MLNFLKNKEKNIVFDIGSQKIGAISYKVVNNKPMIIDMEYQKIIRMMNYQIFYQKILKKFMTKFQIKKISIPFIVMSLTRELFIREVNLKLGKEKWVYQKKI